MLCLGPTPKPNESCCKLTKSWQQPNKKLYNLQIIIKYK